VAYVTTNLMQLPLITWQSFCFHRNISMITIL